MYVTPKTITHLVRTFGPLVAVLDGDRVTLINMVRNDYGDGMMAFLTEPQSGEILSAPQVWLRSDREYEVDVNSIGKLV